MSEAYWPIPAVCVLAASASAVLLVALDERLQREGLPFAFTGEPDSSRSLLSTIAASMLTLAALVFSITIVVLQLANTQFSPRALPSCATAKAQFTLGPFLATFAFALVALREVRATLPIVKATATEIV